MNKLPRLPFVPNAVAAIMSKPVAPPPPAPVVPSVLGQTGSIEYGDRLFPAGAIGSYATDTPVSVYTTQKRWRGADVHVRYTGVTGVSLITYVRIWVYALTGSSRSLVETGWFLGLGSGTTTRRVAAARAIADRFEVVAEISIAGAPPSLPDVMVTVEGADECLDADPSDLAVSMAQTVVGSPITVPNGISTPANYADFKTRLTGAVVTNTTAGVLYWQAVDAASVAAAAGLAPIVSVAIPPTSTVIVPPEALQGYRFGQNGCVCGGSSTAATFTAAGAGAILQQVWGS